MQADDTLRVIECRDGWTLVETYLDQGVSGSKDRRPQLDRMLADARRGKFDILLVWRSDRLFRSLRHMVVALDELMALGVKFVSVQEPFDMTTPQGLLLVQLVSSVAEFERAILIERTKAGLDAARRRGAQIGRPRVHVPVAEAIRLRRQGLSLRQVARKLKVGVATLHRALRAAEVAAPFEDDES
jgi:DNA invertase Pin-like site-specific DNA recombinase